MPVKDYRMIGRRLPRIDAKDKVKGRALYADDLWLPGMLCGMILRSPFPHARILRIDVSRAMILPGVKAVVAGADTLKIRYGVISRSPKYTDECPLAAGKVFLTPIHILSGFFLTAIIHITLVIQCALFGVMTPPCAHTECQAIFFQEMM